MVRSPETVLALAHHATRTGAPGVLLSLLGWARSELGVRPRTVFRRGGPLLADFEALGPTRALRPWGRRGVADVVEVGLGQIGLTGLATRVTAVEALAREPGRPSADLVVVNGVGAAALLSAVDPRAPVAVVVHELATGLDRAAIRADREVLWERAGRVVAVSHRVAESLVADQGVDAGRIEVAHEFVPDRTRVGEREAARSRLGLGLDPDRALVAGVGAGSWRKGIDLFLQVAARVRVDRGDGVHFAWVGPVDDEQETGHDLRALGLEGAVTLVGEVDDPTPWFDALDVLLLTSREDPFPLVVLEAGLAGKPVVSFVNGGAPEVIEPDGGAVVDYLDLDAMAAATVWLLEDDAARTAAGEALRARVRARHVTEVGAPAMWHALTHP